MKKTVNRIKNVFTWIITVISAAVMVFTIVSTSIFNRNDRNIFGYKFFIVLSDSMSATDFSAGDLVVSKAVDPVTLGEGDIITFQSENTDNYGEIITHKIRSVTKDGEGNLGFVTYGTTTNTDDETVVSGSLVLGQYKFHIAKIGAFFNFLKSGFGYFVCIFIPFMLLILLQGLKSVRLFRKYKNEQRAMIDRERQEIAEEKAKNEEMMKQLLEMQAQLAAQNQQADKENKE